jgi:hypothetical protein
VFQAELVPVQVEGAGGTAHWVTQDEEYFRLVLFTISICVRKVVYRRIFTSEKLYLKCEENSLVKTIAMHS